MTNDDQKSVLDVLGRCQDLEKRLNRIEKIGFVIVDSGEVIKKDDNNISKGNGERESRDAITFSHKLESPPIVSCSLAGVGIDPNLMDMQGSGYPTGSNIEVKAENITSSGCDIVIRTWNRSTVSYVKVNWLALSPL